MNHYSSYGYTKPDVRLMLGFCGQYCEPLTGNYPLGNGHRTYSPGLMRFCAPDSLSPFAAGGLNAYAYCAGDPINRYDPSGQFFETAALSLRALGIASNTATLAYNFMGPAPTNRVGLNASRLSTFGSVLSIGSASAQFAGVQSAVFGTNVGTGISLAATATRAAYAAVGPGARPLQQIRENAGLLTSGIPAQAAPDIELTQVRTIASPSLPVRTREVVPAPSISEVEPVPSISKPWVIEQTSQGMRKRPIKRRPSL
ncbi:RHS repeat-associated core domain-containing protein [Pseudomonas sp. NPDC089395]|uniref:RHS repeat-associated core domain-containing protein n=1 Tax=Pseudomonas sp. NPDC089395 TaxID=3364460 RepID=UPI00381DBA16